MPFRIRLLLLFFFTGALFAGQAQKRNNIWAFGDSSGFNFNGETTTVFKSVAEGLEQPPYYISSICDKNGQLLF
ncbi:MAG TPA: hypothetical protein VM010_02320, partial [Chitinophagaceae bacterium]|nr:hypothetical protein [Chitinophagaceae bacterium]